MPDLVQPLTNRHADGVAGLHRSAIATGFLSSLGGGFLRQLYAAIPSCPAGFGFVWEEADGRLLGFIACAESTGRLYKQAMLRRGPLMALPLLRYALRPSVVRRMVETLRYPAQTAAGLPPAEVLSIVVSAEARGKGVGKALMSAALAEFAARGVAEVRVAVGADNVTANRFYETSGFHLAQSREHHGLPMNIYVVDLPVKLR